MTELLLTGEESATSTPRAEFIFSTPSQWLMRKVEQSILAPAIVEARVIPTGVDWRRNSGDKSARSALRLPQNAKILLFAATCPSQHL